MAQKKGQTGNPNGRPIGAKNKNPNELKEWMRKLILDNQQQFIEDLKAVSEKERLDILTRLAVHLTPKAVDPIIEEKEQLFRQSFIDRFFPAK